MKWSVAILTVVAAVFAAEPLAAQDAACTPMSDRMPLEGRASAYDSASVAVASGVAKVCYGSPALRGRTMIGGEAVPFGEIWRTGANEPTTLHVTVPVEVAGIAVEPGAYSLYTIPQDGEPWTLVVNASTTQWGHEGAYPSVQDQDVGRADVDVETLDSPVEQLTFRTLTDFQGLVLEWQNSRVYIPIAPR